MAAAVPIKKAQKYDRQLRLWGDHGQEALERAHVCLINASALGTELLKNLVLPGCGSFTIVDTSNVAAADLGNNFFLTEEDIGKNRGAVAKRFLAELNPDVLGEFVDQDVAHLVHNNPSFFASFDVVMATQLLQHELQLLAKLLWECNVPLLAGRVYGMVGSLRLQVREHTVVESHPDDSIHDLRLMQPFEELLALADSVDLEVPPPVREILDDPKAATSDLQSSPFWILARALREFVDRHGTLPLRGTLPDMESDTQSYITLLNAYRRKADADRLALSSTVTEILSTLGHPATFVTDDETRLFCKNAAFLRVVRCRSIEEELTAPASALLDTQLEDPSSLVTLYVMLLAVDHFHAIHGSFPGALEQTFEEDIPRLQASLASVQTSLGISAVIQEDLVHEFCRYGASELHAMASLLGGIASQEVIKLLTRQYVPFNNTLLLSGISSCVATHAL